MCSRTLKCEDVGICQTYCVSSAKMIEDKAGIPAVLAGVTTSAYSFLNIETAEEFAVFFGIVTTAILFVMSVIKKVIIARVNLKRITNLEIENENLRMQNHFLKKRMERDDHGQ